jgi:hypothetical protein
MKGAASDGEHVRLQEFVIQLDALRKALWNTERLVSRTERTALYYRIVDLRHSSPAVILLEATPYRRQYDVSAQVIHKLFNGLLRIARTGQISADYDTETLLSYKELASTLHRHVTQIKLSSDEYEVDVTTELERNIDRILGSDILLEGSIAGKLEVINIHNKINRFHIFPSVGPVKVICHFPDQMLHQAIKAVGHYVSVTGQTKIRRGDFFPHEIEVFSMETYPDEEELPTLSSLRGIAPDATGGMDSVAFINAIRNAQG